MSDLLSNLQSPWWWLSVVIGGVLVNIVATYLTKLLDGRLAAASSWWRRRREATQRDHAAKLEALRADPGKLVLLMASEARCRFRYLGFLIQTAGIGFIAIMLVTFNAPKWFTFPIIALFAFYVFLYLQQARAAERAESLLIAFYKDTPS